MFERARNRVKKKKQKLKYLSFRLFSEFDC